MIALAESTWERETRKVLSRAFVPLPEDAECGRRLGPGGVPTGVPAREWRLRRAVELLTVAADQGIAEAMLAELVRNPAADSTLWYDLAAVGIYPWHERRADKRGVERDQRVWRIDSDV